VPPVSWRPDHPEPAPEPASDTAAHEAAIFGGPDTDADEGARDAPPAKKRRFLFFKRG
jgi:hypothetical protein